MSNKRIIQQSLILYKDMKERLLFRFFLLDEDDIKKGIIVVKYPERGYHYHPYIDNNNNFKAHIKHEKDNNKVPTLKTLSDIRNERIEQVKD